MPKATPDSVLRRRLSKCPLVREPLNEHLPMRLLAAASLQLCQCVTWRVPRPYSDSLLFLAFLNLCNFSWGFDRQGKEVRSQRVLLGSFLGFEVRDREGRSASTRLCLTRFRDRSGAASLRDTIQLPGPALARRTRSSMTRVLQMGSIPTRGGDPPKKIGGNKVPKGNVWVCLTFPQNVWCPVNFPWKKPLERSYKCWISHPQAEKRVLQLQ